ncbi:uncharacterized protein LOC143292419 [Babylonia areolata]|uniref:uncharacterized protein LOC143292419 n=1 Tax=Babylonia areolata TaxID=304850 RepID=UPI003FD6142B
MLRLMVLESLHASFLLLLLLLLLQWSAGAHCASSVFITTDLVSFKGTLIGWINVDPGFLKVNIIFKYANYFMNHKVTVSFFVPFLPPNERLRSAEIRFLRRSGSRGGQTGGRQGRRGRRRRKRRRRRRRYKLRMQVVREGRVVQKVMLRERAVSQQDYDVIDVTRVLRSWINAHHGNVSLQVRIPRKLEKSILLSDSSLKSTSLVALYLEDREFLRHMYESYTTDQVHVHHNDTGATSGARAGNFRSRGKRSSPSSRENREPKRRKKKKKNKKRWYRAPKHEQCQMYDFKVDFEFIGWGQWIIHPKTFNARFCYGECPSPVDSRFKPTNHAMLQTLMRQKKRRLAPPTCCVPVRLKPLSMMYFEYEEIVVRHHENMIAEDCGCR